MFDKRQIPTPAIPPAPPVPPQVPLDELLAAKAKIEDEIQRRGSIEIEHEVQKMRALASTLGISIANLFGVEPSVVEKTRKKREVKAKYRSPEGEEWSGRGRPPTWLQAYIDQGQTKEDFLIQ